MKNLESQIKGHNGVILSVLSKMAVDILALCHPLLTHEVQGALDHAAFDYKAYLFPFVNLL